MNKGTDIVHVWLVYGESIDHLWIWLVVYRLNPTRRKKMRVRKNWDDDIPNRTGKNVPNHQPL